MAKISRRSGSKLETKGKGNKNEDSGQISKSGTKTRHDCLKWVRVSRTSDWGDGGSNQEGETAHLARFGQMGWAPSSYAAAAFGGRELLTYAL